MSDLRDVKDELTDISLHGLRNRVGAIASFRDAAQDWTDVEHRHIMKALVPYTDAVLHALAKAEMGEKYEPYPHPIGEGPFDGAPTVKGREG